MRGPRRSLLGVLVMVGMLACGVPAWASDAGALSSAVAPGVVPLVSGEPPVVSTEGASAVEETTATLNGSVNPEEGTITDCHFAYVDEAHYQPEAAEPYAEGVTVPCSSIPSGSGPAPVNTEVSGLSAGTRYHFELFATSAAGQSVGGDQVFATPSAPVIEGAAASGVGAAHATLGAQVNPHGLATTYRFQYGKTEAYGSETPETELPAVEEPIAVSAPVTGLTPGSEYHARLVVVNAESTVSSTFSFRALPVGIQGLPDKRVYEMVTPADNENAEVYAPFAFGGGLVEQELESGIQTGFAFQVAVDGDKVVYVAGPTSGGTGQAKVNTGNDYLATRSAGGGWTQVNIQPTGHKNAFYNAFSSDLSSGVLRYQTKVSTHEEPLSPEEPSKGNFSDAAAGYINLFKDSLGEDVYRPLVTESPARLSPEEFGAYQVIESNHVGVRTGATAFAGSSADFGQLLFEANGALTGNAVSPPVQSANNLYDWVDGRLSLVNVLPDGISEANATFGAAPLGSLEYGPDFSHVISEDGSRIFWTDLNTHRLYVSEDVGTLGARAVQVDASQGLGSGGGGRFWTASSDGSKVFFTDCSRLTVDSTAVAGGGCEPGGTALSGSDLYEYDVASGQLTDLTVDHSGSDPLGADVQGVIGVSNDGAYVYFVAEGNLASGASTGQPNLYLWHEGITTFIATLSSQDGSDVAPTPGGDWESGFRYRTAEVTPNGRSVVFMSNASLKTYPSGRAYPSNGLQEVYVYDAEAGHLFCVSCSPSGEAPAISEQDAAAFLPVGWSNTYLPEWISEDGSRVFFDSAAPLVPQDGNGTQDVYEWERDGSGSCREVAGCIYLLSSGTSSTRSWLIGASASGDDVFIATRAQLMPQDGNENYDLYDARVEGVPPASPQECSGAGCQRAPAVVPVLGSPSSATFSGAGNLPPPAPTPAAAPKVAPRSLTRAQKLARALVLCRRERQQHRRAVCEAGARKRYGVRSKAKKSAKGRG